MNSESVQYTIVEIDETVNSNTNETSISKRQPVFTRYLYEVNDVKYMVLYSLIMKDKNQLLFWVYELYISGHQDVLLEFSYNMLNTVFTNSYTLYKHRLNKHIILFREETDGTILKKCLFGNIFINMMYAFHNLKKCETQKGRRLLYISLTPENIKEYVEDNVEGEDSFPVRKTLHYKCKYYILKGIVLKLSKLMGGSKDDIVDIYPSQLNDWLYYSSFSSIWKNRIAKYGGLVDNVNKKVVFDNEDNMEEFYDTYGYEPDECPNEEHICRGVIPNIVNYSYDIKEWEIILSILQNI